MKRDARERDPRARARLRQRSRATRRARTASTIDECEREERRRRRRRRPAGSPRRATPPIAGPVTIGRSAPATDRSAIAPGEQLSAATSSGVSAPYAGQPIAFATPRRRCEREVRPEARRRRASVTTSSSELIVRAQSRASIASTSAARRAVGQLTSPAARGSASGTNSTSPIRPRSSGLRADRVHLPADGDRDHLLREAHRDDRRPRATRSRGSGAREAADVALRAG